jgi:hypothetical protein
MSKFPRRTKDRRDIGQVIFPIEQLMAARELLSCCAGQEAILESGQGLETRRDKSDWRPTGAA